MKVALEAKLTYYLSRRLIGRQQNHGLAQSINIKLLGAQKRTEMPSYLDLAVLIVVLVSGLLAVLRGFTREILAIGSWVAAAAGAYYLHPLALPYIKPYVSKDEIALAGAVAIVFFIALIVVSLLTVKFSDIILDSKIGALDRTLGFLFGAFVFYNWLVPETNQPTWIRNARVKPLLQAGGDKIRDMLPDDLDSIIAKVKSKKGGAPSSDAPPSEAENEKAQTPNAESAPSDTPSAPNGAN